MIPTPDASQLDSSTLMRLRVLLLALFDEDDRRLWWHLSSEGSQSGSDERRARRKMVVVEGTEGEEKDLSSDELSLSGHA